MKIFTAVFFVLCSLSPQAFAKAYYKTKQEMVEKAKAISLIEITAAQNSNAKGKHWTYRTKGKVEETIKGKFVTTKNKSSEAHKELMSSRLTFSRKKNLIYLSAKGEANLPLESIKGKGFEASDGILALNSNFIWPGCGYDRSSYTISKITAEYIVIKYVQGTPEQDGYSDSGQFNIRFNDQ